MITTPVIVNLKKEDREVFPRQVGMITICLVIMSQLPSRYRARITQNLVDKMDAEGLSQAAVAVILGKTQPAVNKARRGEFGRDMAELIVVRALGYDSWVEWCDAEKLDPMPVPLDDMSPKELAIYTMSQHLDRTPGEVRTIVNANGEQLHDPPQSVVGWERLIDQWVKRHDKQPRPKHTPLRVEEGARSASSRKKKR